MCFTQCCLYRCISQFGPSSGGYLFFYRLILCDIHMDFFPATFLDRSTLSINLTAGFVALNILHLKLLHRRIFYQSIEYQIKVTNFLFSYAHFVNRYLRTINRRNKKILVFSDIN